MNVNKNQKAGVMNVLVKKEGIILEKTSFGFENAGVLNPGTILENGKVHLFYRAVREGNYSSIGHCLLDGPLKVIERCEIPLLFSQFDYESHGLEDPRVTKIDGLYYLTYTAYDGFNALSALAVSEDLKYFSKAGLIVPQIGFEEFSLLAGSKIALNEKYTRYNKHWHKEEKPEHRRLIWDKNVVFFPRRVNGKLYFLHRIKPDIQIASVNNLEDLTTEFWQNYFLHFDEHIALTSKYEHEISYIGAGCPPIETEHGWLLIYHGVHDSVNGYVYVACAALMDLNNPQKEISRLDHPLFEPEHHWELKGEVNNVCFPTGTALFGDTLYIYYGAADERIACASLSLSSLLENLILNINHHEK